jgi:hypothetical protein
MTALLHNAPSFGVTRRGRRVRACAMAGLASVLACSDLTRVTNTATTTQQLDNAAGAIVRRNGAIESFASYYPIQAMYSGMLTDELTTAGGQLVPVDRRVVGPSNAIAEDYPYPGLSSARLTSLWAIQSLATYAAGDRARIGELYALVGYVETILAETMCSGVPLGTIGADGAPHLGPTVTMSRLLQAAIAHFDSAAKFATDSGGATDPMVTNLASVGLGRALLDSGDFARAEQAVAEVPTTFAYALQFASGISPQNTLAIDFQNGSITVSDFEGGTGLGFVSAHDPRLLLDSTTSSTIYGRPVYFPVAFMGAPSMLVASGIEARLIAAEAYLHGGELSAWTGTLNALRAQASATVIPPLPPDSTMSAPAAFQLAVQFRERAFWLYATGHRQGDLRRLVRQYGLSASSVFPVGSYPGGGTYGSDVTFVPFDEQANPNFSGCFNRDP